MPKEIKKVAVLGSGLMGGGIAALAAAVGAEVVMLDIAPRELTQEDRDKGWTLETKEFRNKIVQAGLDRVLDPKNMIIYEKSLAKRITIGNFSDDMALIQDCDWIVEVIIEKLEPKQALMNEIAKYRKKGSIVSSNTSGIPVTWIVEGQDEEFKRNFLGTHFFNPVRFMKLLELIPTAYTDSSIIDFMSRYGEQVLGKAIVICKDTPDFVANRIGGFAMINAINLGIENQWDVPTLDVLTGPIIGRPNSGTYRLADLVGVDLMLYTGLNKVKNVPTDKEREQIRLNPVLEKMVAKGLLGDKAKQGFYKKEVIDGKRVTLALNLETLTYQPAEIPDIPCVKQALASKNKYKTMVDGECEESLFVWEILKGVLLYSAERVPEIADDYKMIDRAMRSGYNWEKGPFEIWDALGVKETANRMVQEGEVIPEWVLQRINNNLPFYTQADQENQYIHLKMQSYPVVIENADARILDLGDQVLCLEFKTKGNTLTDGVNDMIETGVGLLHDHQWKGLVIGNNGKSFSFGADLRAFVESDISASLEGIERVSGRFEYVCNLLKYAPKPVVAAPYGRALGGGCEVPMHSTFAVVAPETYMGLVEVGVGLIPGGGGCKEMLFQTVLTLQDKTAQTMIPAVTKVWQGIMMATVSSSGFDAIKKGFLPKNSRVVMNTDALLSEAKATVLANWQSFVPNQRIAIPALGKVGISHFEKLIQGMVQTKVMSEHDAVVATKAAYVLCGGDIEFGTLIQEEDILQLERRAFAELALTEKTKERIQYTLKFGKPLRN